MHKFFLMIVAITFAGVVAAQDTTQQQQPSLADLARKNRTQQKAPAIARYDEESFRSSQPTPPPQDADKTGDETDQAKDADKKPADAKTDADAKAKEKQKAKDDMKAKIDSQKNEISMLQRELDVDQREQRLRAAAFYGDAGSQLRDQAKFADDSRKQQEDIDSKKQKLDSAQQKLADLEEASRKSADQ